MLVIVTVTPGSTPPERVVDGALDGAVGGLRLRECRNGEHCGQQCDQKRAEPCVATPLELNDRRV